MLGVLLLVDDVPMPVDSIRGLVSWLRRDEVVDCCLLVLSGSLKVAERVT